MKVFEDIGYLFYVVFIVCISFAGVVYDVFLPETKGAILEDISSFFGDPVVATLHESESRLASVLETINGITRPKSQAGAVEHDKSEVAQIEQVA